MHQRKYRTQQDEMKNDNFPCYKIAYGILEVRHKVVSSAYLFFAYKTIVKILFASHSF